MPGFFCVNKAGKKSSGITSTLNLIYILQKACLSAKVSLIVHTQSVHSIVTKTLYLATCMAN